jgi:hypothetical protein
MPNSVGLAVGEHAITVQWCEREPSAVVKRCGNEDGMDKIANQMSDVRTIYGQDKQL